jgi:hypothetical protein
MAEQLTNNDVNDPNGSNGTTPADSNKQDEVSKDTTSKSGGPSGSSSGKDNVTPNGKGGKGGKGAKAPKGKPGNQLAKPNGTTNTKDNPAGDKGGSVNETGNAVAARASNDRLDDDVAEQIRKHEAKIAKARYCIRVLKKNDGNGIADETLGPIDGIELTDPIMEVRIMYIPCSCYPLHNYPGYGNSRVNEVYRNIVKSAFYSDPVNFRGDTISAKDVMLLDEVQIEHYRLIRYFEQCLSLSRDVLSQRTSISRFSALNTYVRGVLKVTDISVYEMLVKRFEYIIDRITLPFGDDVYEEINRDLAINYTINHKRCITLGIKAFSLLVDGEIVEIYDLDLVDIISLIERFVECEYNSESLLYQHNVLRSTNRYVTFKSTNV